MSEKEEEDEETGKGGVERRERGEKYARRRSADERDLDARFFQRGHGRMDVGIMEASTVPSVRDKNCR